MTSRIALEALNANGSRHWRLTVRHAEMFIHDSLHAAKNAAFEMGRPLPSCPPGAVMLVDDIGSHDSFPGFARRYPQYPSR